MSQRCEGVKRSRLPGRRAGLPLALSLDSLASRSPLGGPLGFFSLSLVPPSHAHEPEGHQFGAPRCAPVVPIQRQTGGDSNRQMLTTT